MRTKFQKGKGIIIKTRNSKEADKIITVIGSEISKRSFLVPGIMKSQKRSILATELGSYIDFEFVETHDLSLRSFKSFHLLDRFENLKTTYLGLCLITYFSEWTDQFFLEGEEHDKIFQLLFGSFEFLDKNQFQESIIPYFKYRSMKISGFSPDDLVENDEELFLQFQEFRSKKFVDLKKQNFKKADLFLNRTYKSILGRELKSEKQLYSCLTTL